jgi:hypothetical protein
VSPSTQDDAAALRDERKRRQRSATCRRNARLCPAGSLKPSDRAELATAVIDQRSRTPLAPPHSAISWPDVCPTSSRGSALRRRTRPGWVLGREQTATRRRAHAPTRAAPQSSIEHSSAPGPYLLPPVPSRRPRICVALSPFARSPMNGFVRGAGVATAFDTLFASVGWERSDSPDARLDRLGHLAVLTMRQVDLQINQEARCPTSDVLAAACSLTLSPPRRSIARAAGRCKGR